MLPPLGIYAFIQFLLSCVLIQFFTCYDSLMNSKLFYFSLGGVSRGKKEINLSYLVFDLKFLFFDVFDEKGKHGKDH